MLKVLNFPIAQVKSREGQYMYLAAATAYFDDRGHFNTIKCAPFDTLPAEQPMFAYYELYCSRKRTAGLPSAYESQEVFV